MNPITLVCCAMGLMSLVSFCAMGLDKHFAKHAHRRIPEKRLFLFALLGGAAGGLAGMYLFRHKTRHWYFVWGFWALALLQWGGVLALCVLQPGFLLQSAGGHDILIIIARKAGEK